MQLLLSFAQQPPGDPEPSPNVWSTLDAQRKNETLALLSHLLAKAVTASAKPVSVSCKKRREPCDD